ncbi:MAG TPA: hypothetical protein VFB32_13095 [Rudaea sp.]|nr:hypothetical protein [Rudaea sp.]
MRTLDASPQLTNTVAAAAPNTRAAGLVIAASAIASIVFVALDEGGGGKDALSIMQSMVKAQPMHQLVHVVAMACIGGFMYGYGVLSQRLGLNRTPVLVGLVSYALGTVLMLLGTVVDGFVSTDAAAMFVGGSPEAIEQGFRIVSAFSWVLLPDLARVAWVFQSVAAVAWSCALLRERGMQRAAGVVGLLAGALPAVIVFIVGTRMTDTVVVTILLAQGIWNIAAAAALVFRRKSEAYVPTGVAEAF